MILNLVSSHPYEDLLCLHPARHHIILGHVDRDIHSIYRQKNIKFELDDPEFFLKNQQRFDDFCPVGLELLCETTLISLWVPRTSESYTNFARGYTETDLDANPEDYDINDA
ncbi:hypothetical protein A2U01_0004437 [Trifolium medium]|uniref:Uncharacterized protein n=1 Tax=Trifolium medium TaxID=97028 RepID=A0A392M8K1_9FABA|nr:hypothetical protein [Trifolium medium]